MVLLFQGGDKDALNWWYLCLWSETEHVSFKYKCHCQNSINKVNRMGQWVVLDEHLTWKPHISHVARKIYKAVGILYKVSFFLSKLSLHTLYYSLVYLYLFYCIAVWGYIYPTNLKRLVILQKLVRIVNKDAFNTHTDPIFAELKLLKVDQIF